MKRWPVMLAVALIAACGGETTLPSGLDCLAISESVDSYRAAYDYYLAEGRPASLDSDGNGVPCEEDFSPREIADVVEASTTTTTTTATTTTSGTTTTDVDATTTTNSATTTSPQGTTSTTPEATTTSTIDVSAPVGQFASAVGGTTPRVCQRWEDELIDQNSEILDNPFFGPLRQAPTVGVGTIAVFCVFGFDFDNPIQVEVTGPNQQTTTFSVALDSLEDPNTAADPLEGANLIGDGDVEGVQWVIASGHDLGVYQFVTTQGELTSDATVEIVPATAARIDTFVENRGGFPSSLGFALSGFPSRASIQLGIYKDITEPFIDDGTTSDHLFELTAPIGMVTADQFGAVVVQLEDGEFDYVSGHRYCLATTIDLIENPVCDNFRGGWFTP